MPVTDCWEQLCQQPAREHSCPADKDAGVVFFHEPSDEKLVRLCSALSVHVTQPATLRFPFGTLPKTLLSPWAAAPPGGAGAARTGCTPGLTSAQAPLTPRPTSQTWCGSSKSG